jgi:nucleotide-binding universal stress UspA family protein
MRKVSLAGDMSRHARRAVPAAAELARAGGGSVHVLHVREFQYPVPATVVGDTPRRPSSWSTRWSPNSSGGA